MSETTTIKPLVLRLKVRQTTTVLPRCLQILSRRGFILTSLVTDQKDGNATLTLTIEGPERWHRAMPQLLVRLVDVESAAAIQGSTDE